MKRWIATSLFLALPLALQAEETYRTLNPDGTVEFSDTPSESAEPFDIPTPQTYNPSDYAVPRTPRDSSEGIDQGGDYSGFAITAPTDDSNFHSGDGNVSVSLRIPAGGEENLMVVVQLDGREVARGPGPGFTLHNVDRGTHRLSAQLLSDSGAVLATAPTITFHLQRRSLQHPRSQ